MTDSATKNARRGRILFRCWHRGTQESDVLLGSFADTCLPGLDEAQLERFEALLGCSDPDLFDWILGGGTPPAQYDHDVLYLLRAYWARRQGDSVEPRMDMPPRT
jgi:antitoxin CptB